MKQFLLICTFLFSLQSFAQGSLEGDRLALVALYNATDGPNWFLKSGWTVTAGSSPCGWYGVACEGGRVTELDLSKSGLNGGIPAEIGNLDQLKSLTLGWSRLPGDDGIHWPMPIEIGNLLNLEHLDLSGNTGRDDWRSGAIPIGGPIPSSLGNLTKLTYLDLGYWPNDIGFDPFGFLSGSIPPELGNLVNLTFLDISNQSLTGNLPAELGNLTKMKILFLGANDFSGVIPASFNNFSQIEFLDLSFWGYQRGHEFGMLHGAVPDLSGLPLAAKVYLGGNSFTFAGMESNISHLTSYSYQAKLPMYGNFPLGSYSSGPVMLFVEAGGTLAKNTYKWYKEGILVETKVGNKYFEPSAPGTYFVEVTNSIATKLTLRSVDYTFTAMPVTLAAFYGINNPEGNMLTWKTTSETNNSGFDIEKSSDAKVFEKIGFVDGNGNSKENKIYQFADQNPFPTSYYRLKQIDYNGKFEYSRIISVKRDNEIFSVYPNPAKNELFLNGIDKKEEMTVRNLEGIIILQESVLPKWPVNISNFSNGVYTVTVGGETKRIVVQN